MTPIDKAIAALEGAKHEIICNLATGTDWTSLEIHNYPALKNVREALTELKAARQSGVPDGWVLVPREPTEEIEGLDEAIDGVAEYQQLRQRYGFTKKITQHISVVLEAARRYAALPHCPDGFVCVSKDRLTQLLEMKDKVTEKCKDHEWSLWGTGCLYAGNFCLIRKGGYVDHEEAWDDAAYFIVNAADFCDEIRLLIAAAEGNK